MIGNSLLSDLAWFGDGPLESVSGAARPLLDRAPVPAAHSTRAGRAHRRAAQAALAIGRDAPLRLWRPSECRVRAPSRPCACGAFSAPPRVAPAWHFRWLLAGPPMR